MMSLSKRYNPATAEPQLQASWQNAGVYHFSPDKDKPVYSVDTPPPTVSGNLHMGHVYSYTQTDLMARFWRMNGYNVYYPMGFDDNGLPTDQLVEKRFGIHATDVGRRAFIEMCLEVSELAEKDYKALWQRLGLSIDWRFSYSTINELSRRTSQLSFLDLYDKELVYRQEAPVIWCPHCHTAIAQAELNDLERESELVTLAFHLGNGDILPIATTRPELLPACVAVFVHPNDKRYQALVGQQVIVPLTRQAVPLLADIKADPEKGTGAVMCCTFGDTTDVEWWYTHNLPLKVIIGREGRLTEAAGKYSDLDVKAARFQIVEDLGADGLLLARTPINQSVRVHERCDTPVEFIVARQWFVRVLDYKKLFLDAGEQITWHPAHMQARYREWVEKLGWDWCISRQRYYGVTFPVWYCNACGKVILADEKQLPVDPTEQLPDKPCECGSTSFTPEEDVMDTWATSSMSPQIVGRWLSEKSLYERVFPFSLRTHAHEIIRTWTFYTIVKSLHHFGVLPWKEIALSGWGLLPEGMGKISKSRGGGPIAPLEIIEKYSADAVRYWAASTSYGKDTIISEEKIALGAKLVTKLWNVARFSEPFLQQYRPAAQLPAFTPTDYWLLARIQRLVQRAKELFRNYDHAVAKSEIENFFWRDLADNYLEMAKERLYDTGNEQRDGARYTLYLALLTTIKLFAPFLPHVTEEIYQALFVASEGSSSSLHSTSWPTVNEAFVNESAEAAGEALIEVATAVRRYKSESSISLGTELMRLQLATEDAALASTLRAAAADIKSVTRARQIEVTSSLDASLETIKTEGTILVAIAR